MVAGEGPLPCPGLILGEAPGRHEIEQGRPFVGPSGQLLDMTLNLLGLPRSEIYITNVVKDWPRDEVGATRRPTTAEIAAWRPMLDVELEQCSAGAVLLLGKTAAESWGWSHELVDQGIYAAFHPAYVLRQKHDDPHIYERWLFSLRPFIHSVRVLRKQL